MAYIKGDLRIKDHRCPMWGSPEAEDHICDGPYHIGLGAYLPHSCDEWEIGGREAIEALIADLQEALDKL